MTLSHNLEKKELNFGVEERCRKGKGKTAPAVTPTAKPKPSARSAHDSEHELRKEMWKLAEESAMDGF